MNLSQTRMGLFSRARPQAVHGLLLGEACGLRLHAGAEPGRPQVNGIRRFRPNILFCRVSSFFPQAFDWQGTSRLEFPSRIIGAASCWLLELWAAEGLWQRDVWGIPPPPS